MTDAEAGYARLRSLVEDEPVAPGDGPGVVGWLQRLCRTAARVLASSGVNVVVMSDSRNELTVGASGDASRRMEDLQFSPGEGPCLESVAIRRPVLTPDLADPTVRWPVYALAAREYGVRAVFAFPLQVGMARLGALGVYRDAVGQLSPKALGQALTFAEIARRALLDALDSPRQTASLASDVLGSRFEVYQAQGMVMIQLAVGAGEAIARIRGCAFSQSRSVADVSRDIVARRLVLSSDERPRGAR
jgi:GAF domain-containing protein